MIGIAPLLLLALAAPASPAALPAGSLRTARLEIRFAPALDGPARALAAVAESDLDDLCTDLGGCPEGPPLVVVVADDNAELRRHLGEGVPPWASGVAFPEGGGAGVALSGGRSWAEVRRTFRHELSHLLLHRVVAGRAVPRWFKEGFATVQSGGWSFDRVRALTGAALTGRLLRFDDLERRFPTGAGEVNLAYAQAIAFVSFLLGQDVDAFGRAIRALRDGAALPAALVAGYGRSVAQLESDWHDALTRDYRLVPLLTGGTTLWVVATMIFLLGYLRRRRQAQATLARWEAEETIV